MFRFDIVKLNVEYLNNSDSDIKVSGECEVISHGNFKRIAKFKFEDKPGSFSLNCINSSDKFTSWKVMSVYLQTYCGALRNKRFFWSNWLEEAVMIDSI